MYTHRLLSRFLRSCATCAIASSLALCVAHIPQATALSDPDPPSSLYLTDFCQIIESAGTSATEEETQPSPQDTRQAQACADTSDAARLHLDDPDATPVTDRYVLTTQERASVARAVRQANEHLIAAADDDDVVAPVVEEASPTAQATIASTPETEGSRSAQATPATPTQSPTTPSVTAYATETSTPVEEHTSTPDETQPTASGEVTDTESAEPDTAATLSSSDRPLTEDELTYRENETVPYAVDDRRPGIYVDSLGQAAVVFTDGSYHFFPQDVTVTDRPAVKTRSARSAPAPAALAAAASSTVTVPGADTANVFNALYLNAPTTPSEIVLDSTPSGTATAAPGNGEVGQVPSRPNESQAASNEHTPLSVTKEDLTATGGKVKVSGASSQATVWSSNISDYNNGRYQPTPAYPRLPASVAPRMTVTDINFDTMTAKVTYQFHADYTAYLTRNRSSGQTVSGMYISPYQRYRSDPNGTGDNVAAYFLPTGAGATAGNCRSAWTKTNISTPSGIAICFGRTHPNYDKLSATVPIVRVEGAFATYRIQTGFNSDWLVATLDSQVSVYDYVRASMFDSNGVYRTTSATYHLIETLRVQIPDVVVSLPPTVPELPLTGGVSDLAYRAAGAGLLAVALVLMGVHVHQRQAQHPRRTAHAA